MRKNIQIILIILTFAIVIGLGAMLVEGLKDDKKSTATPTPIITMPPASTEETPTPETTKKPAATSTPEPTNTPVPTNTPAVEITPSTEPTASPEVTGGAEQAFTEEQQKAVDTLLGVSADELGLTKDLADCYLSFDDWTTSIGSDICYNINVSYEKDGYTTTFYVSTQQTAVYKNIDGEFIKLSVN